MKPAHAPTEPAQAPPPNRERNRNRLVIAGCFFVVVLSFAGPLLLGDAVVGSEHLTEVTAVHHEIARAASELRLPEWTDRIGIGAPLTAEIGAGSLYPPMWLMGALPMPWGSDLLLILHLLLAAVGASKLLLALGGTPLSSLRFWAPSCSRVRSRSARWRLRFLWR
jgi:hypothetical protein